MVELHDDPDAVEVARVAPVSFHLGYRVRSCTLHGVVGRAGGRPISSWRPEIFNQSG